MSCRGLLLNNPGTSCALTNLPRSCHGVRREEKRRLPLTLKGMPNLTNTQEKDFFALISLPNIKKESSAFFLQGTKVKKKMPPITRSQSDATVIKR